MKIVIVFFILWFNIQNMYSQIIPENRFKFLTNVGLEFERPQNYDHVIDVCASPYFLTPDPEGNPLINYNKLVQIIEDARNLSGWKVIYFSQGGTYRIGWTINLGPQDNKLIFKGAGSVLLHFKVGPQIQAHEFNIQGYNDGLPININETLIKGAKTINTTSAANFHVGDWVEIKNNWATVPNLDWIKIGQISKIESIQGNTITLRDEFSLDYSNTYGTTIQKFIPAQNIGFEDLLLAEHTTLGNVTNRLNATDQNYAELVRDEMITLEFTAPDIEEGMERTFVFVSSGRYETDERLNKQNISGTYEEPVLPNETKLYENFPNPFNPITTIKYSLKNESKVTIKIYNSVGEEIEVLVNEFKPAGFYEIQFNASNLASGMYIYRMETADYTLSRKMLILK